MHKNAYDLKDKKFNMLTGIKRVENNIDAKGRKSAQWLFKCECGGERILTVSRVVLGVTKNCGCIRYENRNRKYEPQEASYRGKVTNYKSHAKLRGLSWELTIDDASKLLKNNCFYCDSPPDKSYNSIKNRKNEEKDNSKMSKKHTEDGTIFFSGIDRLNSNLGYTKENSVSCCTFCNFAKNDKTLEEFYAWIDRLVTYRSKNVAKISSNK